MKLKRFWPIFLFLTAFAVCAVVFIDVLPYYSEMQAPDAAPSFGITSLLRRMLPWMNGTATIFTHDDFLKILPPPAYHELSFILSTALLALAMGAYLHTIGLPAAACFAGGMAMAFSGYHFTLFNAGHRGYFIMMPNVILMFALFERALTRPRWFHFTLLAICALVGIAHQPDVFVMLMMLLAAYGLFRLIQATRRIGFKKYSRTYWRKHLFGIAVMTVVFVVLGRRTVENVFNLALAGREKQLQSLTQGATPPGGAVAGAAAKTTEQIKEEKEAQWIFATNWSLPPEDMAEFFAPCIRGLDSFNRNLPYWGRIGQTLGWEETKQGFPNYRQHTIYLGATQSALALFALVAAITLSFRKRGGNATETDGAETPAPENLIGITFFWTAAAIACILLAMGRYTPIYKVFYALPFMDKVRGPLKFVHLTEVALSILFAIGITRLIKKPTQGTEPHLKKAGKITMILTIIASAACLIAASFFDPAVHSDLWTSLRLPTGQPQENLAKLYTGGFMRSSWILAIAAASIGMVSFSAHEKRRFTAGVFAALLIAIVVIDMAEVGRRFVVPIDKTYAHAKSPAYDAITGGGAPDGLAFSYLRLTGQPGSHPFIETLGAEGLASMDPLPGEGSDSWRVKSFVELNKDQESVIKHWKLWGAGAIFMQPQMAMAIKEDIGTITGAYDFDGALRFTAPRNPRQPMAVAVKPAGMVPPVAVYYGWRTAPDADSAIAVIADPAFNMDKQIVITGEDVEDVPTDRVYTPGGWIKAPSESNGNFAMAKAFTDKPGMLLIRENLMRTLQLVATVNGGEAPLYKANGIFLCVPVDAGESEVVLRPYISWASIIWNAAAICFAIIALAAFARSEAMRSASPEQD